MEKFQRSHIYWVLEPDEKFESTTFEINGKELKEAEEIINTNFRSFIKKDYTMRNKPNNKFL